MVYGQVVQKAGRKMNRAKTTDRSRDSLAIRRNNYAVAAYMYNYVRISVPLVEVDLQLYR